MKDNRDDWDVWDDDDEPRRLPSGAAFFYLAPVALVFWGLIIWWVLE